MIPRREFIQSTLKTLVAAAPMATIAATTEPAPQFAVYFSRSGSTCGQSLIEALIVANEHQIEVRFAFNDRLLRAFPSGEWEEYGTRHPRFPYSHEPQP